ncbi:MAG: hypothetical protein R3A51_06750 [Nannocystaceae bacterium]|nr:hypothetical protein [Myxococcales bacterium]
MRGAGEGEDEVDIHLAEIILSKRTKYQEIMIARTKSFGRTLFLDDLVQSSEYDDPLYHEALVHPALVIHGRPRNVLVGGTGEGAAVREILRHPTVERVLTVDLDDDVVQACREHLPFFNEGVFEDPRVEYRVEGVEQTIAEAAPGSFDAIFLDITDPTDEGPAASLFSAPFLERLAPCLADDGVLIAQCGELEVVDLEMPRAVRSTLLEVFGWVHVAYQFVPCFHSLWGFAIASKRPLERTPVDLEARVARLGPDLRVYTPLAHRAMLELPPFLDAMMRTPGEVIRGRASDVIWTYPSKK